MPLEVTGSELLAELGLGGLDVQHTGAAAAPAAGPQPGLLAQGIDDQEFVPRRDVVTGTDLQQQVGRNVQWLGHRRRLADVRPGPSSNADPPVPLPDEAWASGRRFKTLEPGRMICVCACDG